MRFCEHSSVHRLSSQESQVAACGQQLVSALSADLCGFGGEPAAPPLPAAECAVKASRRRVQAGMIVDDELNRLLVNPLGPGVRLHAVIDACHSGTVLDLEYRCKVKSSGLQWKMEYAHQPSVYKVRVAIEGGQGLVALGRVWENLQSGTSVPGVLASSAFQDTAGGPTARAEGGCVKGDVRQESTQHCAPFIMSYTV